MKTLYISRRYAILMLFPVMLLASMVYLPDDQRLAGKVLVVDAGHGGIDPGANRTGIVEKDINLAVALELKDVLNQYGVKVVLTRQSDTELSGECDNEKVKGRYRRDLMARVEMAEESDADIFISMHANAVNNSKRHGADVFYYAKSPDGKALANAIQAELAKVTQTSQSAKTADYFVLRRNKIPAALIEVGYITNRDERALLQNPEYQRKLAEAIAKGIYQYYQQL